MLPLYRRPAYGLPARRLWWLDPTRIVLGILLPIYLSLLAFDFATVTPVTYVPSGLYYWGIVLMLALALGAGFGAYDYAPDEPAERIEIPRALMFFLLAVTLAGYAVWFYPLALNPGLIAEIAFAGRINVRDQVSTLPGVTTLSQCALAYVIAFAIRRWAGWQRIAWWERAGLWLIGCLALFRAFVWSERLAAIELIVCYAVAVAAFYRFRTVERYRAAALAPIVAPFVLYLAFVGTEYFRSWDFYRHFYSSIWEFGFERLAAYYATAVNNGIGLLVESKQWPRYNGAYMFEWAYVLPGLGSILSGYFGDPDNDYHAFLANHAREEFNNPSGIFPIVYDVGYFGSVLYFLLVGLLIGFAYRAYRRRYLGGLLFFPTCVMFIVELLRFNYFAASRYIPAFGALLLVYAVARRRRIFMVPVMLGSRP
ncbi:MAG TPA: O-antigen polymerase [Burkholderiaceae bacterium]|nr:O-antigen polymerase [Burkholderiaceae bacterium]